MRGRTSEISNTLTEKLNGSNSAHISAVRSLEDSIPFRGCVVACAYPRRPVRERPSTNVFLVRPRDEALPWNDHLHWIPSPILAVRILTSRIRRGHSYYTGPRFYRPGVTINRPPRDGRHGLYPYA